MWWFGLLVLWQLLLMLHEPTALMKSGGRMGVSRLKLRIFGIISGDGAVMRARVRIEVTQTLLIIRIRIDRAVVVRWISVEPHVLVDFFGKASRNGLRQRRWMLRGRKLMLRLRQ